MNHFIEIRSLNIKPGTRDEFHRHYIEEALPLLQRWNFDVVAHGPSLHDENTYYVIRRYDSLAQRDEMEDAYYASDDWRKGPREAMIALIDFYIDIVLTLEDVAVQGLRRVGNHFVEVRSYNLKPGESNEFHRLFLEEAHPLLRRWNVDVVAYGPSLHDENTYYLMRGFDSLSQREESEDSFYGSEAWRKGPREQILALIENYTEIVLALEDITVQGLRKDLKAG